MRTHVTIIDVAKEAGVSAGTVSRVLNNRDRSVKISEPTRQLVLAAVRKLNYRPNLSGSALRTQRTGVIGAIVRDISDPFLSLLARELQKAAHAEGVELLLGHAQYDLETAERQVNIMRNWFDGVFLIGDMHGDQKISDELKAYQTPSVAVARGTQSDTPSVHIDEEKGVRIALDYLYAMGHRRIAFIGNPELAGVQERLGVFDEYVREKSLEWRADYLQVCPNVRGASIPCIGRLLSLPVAPTAVLCSSDLLAIGAVSGAWQMGWRVPDTISVIGFDDTEEATSSFPELTTIRQPVGDIAQEAVRLLMRLVEHNSPEDVQLQIKVLPRLIVRRSCAPPIA
ncbi:MAG: LacI family DNA-binding transcriptional regulator [Aggregatilineales bacterium]